MAKVQNWGKKTGGFWPRAKPETLGFREESFEAASLQFRVFSMTRSYGLGVRV